MSDTVQDYSADRKLQTFATTAELTSVGGQDPRSISDDPKRDEKPAGDDRQQASHSTGENFLCVESVSRTIAAPSAALFSSHGYSSFVMQGVDQDYETGEMFGGGFGGHKPSDSSSLRTAMLTISVGSVAKVSAKRLTKGTSCARMRKVGGRFPLSESVGFGFLFLPIGAFSHRGSFSHKITWLSFNDFSGTAHHFFYKWISLESNGIHNQPILTLRTASVVSFVSIVSLLLFASDRKGFER